MSRLQLAVVLALAVLQGCASEAQPRLARYEYQRMCMGVRTRIVLCAPDEALAEAAAAAAFDRIGQLDQIMSDYRPISELNRLSDRAPSEPVVVSEDLASVLRTARHVSRATDGAFDITIGPAVQLWRESRRTGALPDAQALAGARTLVGWNMVRLDERHRSVRLGRPGMRLDLGGIAKGYAAQQAVDLLRKRGLPRCLVALSGDIVVGDPPVRDSGAAVAQGWRIGISPEAWEVPVLAGDAATGHPMTELLLSNAAISTSGDAMQYFEIGGVRYSHIVDPATGIGLTNGYAAAVIAPRGEIADALASAACILGPERAAAAVNRFQRTTLRMWRRSESGALEPVPARDGTGLFHLLLEGAVGGPGALRN